MQQAAATRFIDGGAPEPFRSRLVPANVEVAEIRRIGWITPESVQSLVEDAELCGRGARLEIRLSDRTPESGRAWLAGLTTRLRRRGIAVEVIDESASGSAIAEELLSRRATRTHEDLEPSADDTLSASAQARRGYEPSPHFGVAP